MFNPDIGEALQGRMKKLKISKKDLCKKTSYTKETIDAIVKGNIVHLHSLVEVCSHLGVGIIVKTNEKTINLTAKQIKERRNLRKNK